MQLITKEIERAFERQGDTSQLETSNIKVICKMFNPVGVGTWYLYEKETDDIYWGFVNLGNRDFAECGTVSMNELKNLHLPLGMSIERDRGFPVGKYTLKEVIDKIKDGGHV